MAKKRKTRQEKIILQLKRELAEKTPSKAKSSKKQALRQEAISKPKKTSPSSKKKPEKTDNSIYFYDPLLVRNDLVKTLILSLIALSLEFMLYLRLG